VDGPVTLPRKEHLAFGSPAIGEAEIDEVVATLRSGWLTTGPRVARFEEMFARYVGTEHAVALASCTGALHLSMLAAGVGAGDEVITTPMTFCATAHAIVHAGARPVFVDVEADTGNIDPDAIEAAVTSHTAAILPVHLAGRPCRMDRIEGIARRRGLLLLEDAAHAAGAAWRGRAAGSFGRAGCFSFYATKSLVTGEGGMVTTNDRELARTVRAYAHHGLSEGVWRRFSGARHRHAQAVLPGFKCNMTDVQAALGIHQLARLDEEVRRRAEIWRRYDDALETLPVTRPAPVEEGVVHARHLYSVLVDVEEVGEARDQVLDELLAAGIGAGVHFVPVHLHPYYRETLGHREGEFPNAEHIGERTLSLPLSARLTEQDVDDVAAALGEVLGARTPAGAA
jgi:dTDP-4-amino-4,6-dideoxygalactose transaminase